ncbi:hypothetical protein L3X38_032360 [Prunus dulcis]|uniref:Protein kinase domain-containing protein n=1 Tax=Prunus dulcis TaxID=3755 RepID=A0AAD4YWJ4_PRUDU|nr:hypothetical protein L3X38_032360 [Prunus dulcis]
MATERAPWPCVSAPVLAMYLIGFSSEVPEIPSSLSKQGRDFVTKCLMRDPMERWSAGEILKHGFLLEAPNYLLSPTTYVAPIRIWVRRYDTIRYADTANLQKIGYGYGYGTDTAIKIIYIFKNNITRKFEN